VNASIKKLATRWAIYLAATTAVWPGLWFWIEFISDDRNMYDDANELAAFGVIFSPMPIVLFIISAMARKRSWWSTTALACCGTVGLVITTLRSCWDALSGGLSASSKEDVDYLEWDKIAVWTVIMLIVWLMLIFVDFVVRFSFRWVSHLLSRPLDHGIRR